MKKEQILKKVIEKAEKNGYSSLGSDWYVKRRTGGPMPYPEPYLMVASCEVSFYEIIFDHQFAKAFWGEEWICGSCGKKKLVKLKASGDALYCVDCGQCFILMREYQFRLTQLALAKDRLKYLEKFLKEDK